MRKVQTKREQKPMKVKSLKSWLELELIPEITLNETEFKPTCFNIKAKGRLNLNEIEKLQEALIRILDIKNIEEVKIISDSKSKK
jgi:hypothetical protein